MIPLIKFDWRGGVFNHLRKMADLLGDSPNRIDELFSELEKWETILSQELSDEYEPEEPPDLTPDI